MRTGEGWLYLAVVLDLGSRRLLGYQMSDRIDTRLVADALDMAGAARAGRTAGIVFHSDRGSQGGFCPQQPSHLVHCGNDMGILVRVDAAIDATGSSAMMRPAFLFAGC